MMANRITAGARILTLALRLGSAVYVSQGIGAVRRLGAAACRKIIGAGISSAGGRPAAAKGTAHLGIVEEGAVGVGCLSAASRVRRPYARHYSIRIAVSSLAVALRAAAWAAIIWDARRIRAAPKFGILAVRAAAAGTGQASIDIPTSAAGRAAASNHLPEASCNTVAGLGAVKLRKHRALVCGARAAADSIFRRQRRVVAVSNRQGKEKERTSQKQHAECTHFFPFHHDILARAETSISLPIRCAKVLMKPSVIIRLSMDRKSTRTMAKYALACTMPKSVSCPA
jgi:hypothetical protein